MRTRIKQRQINARRPARHDAAPRLPHEHDESHDSGSSGPREDMQQAYKDLDRGLVDTDLRGARGVEETVRKQKLPAGQPESMPEGGERR